MKLTDVLAIASKENGFYITDLLDKSTWNNGMFFQDSDDFYERPYSKYMVEREVTFIEVKGNRLNIILK